MARARKLLDHLTDDERASLEAEMQSGKEMPRLIEKYKLSTSTAYRYRRRLMGAR